MPKRITKYSKLSKEERVCINSMLSAGELKILEVNFKKGVIVQLKDVEFIVLLDTWKGFGKKEEGGEDEDGFVDEEEFENSNKD